MSGDNYEARNAGKVTEVSLISRFVIFKVCQKLMMLPTCFDRPVAVTKITCSAFASVLGNCL